MPSVEKYTKNLDDKKQAVVNTPFPKKKLLKTEKVTTSEEVYKRTKSLDDEKQAVFTTPLLNKKLLKTEKVTTSEEFDKGNKKMEWYERGSGHDIQEIFR